MDKDYNLPKLLMKCSNSNSRVAYPLNIWNKGQIVCTKYRINVSFCL